MSATRTFGLGLDYAQARDAADPLRPFAAGFYQRPGTIYLDGNSLGLISRAAEAAVLAAVAEWKEHAIEGWTSGERPWFYTAERLGALTAPLVGAEPDEVAVTGTTTVNLHTLVTTFYRPAGRRTKIVACELDFPSDIYALQSQLRLRGYDPAEHLVLLPSADGRTLREDDIIARMLDDVALVLLPSVFFRSGQLLDLARLTQAAHARGILIGFDCCHSAGSVPHRLHDWGVDFAFWCGYKYLNGGPGATAGLFVHRQHFGTMPGLAGWFGSDKQQQFDMALTFEPAAAAGAWQISTPALLSSAGLYGALAMFAEAGLDRLRAKSLDLTAYLMFLVDELLAPLGYQVGTPREDERRGGHVAVEHADALRITKALKQRGIVPDFRFPNVIRLAPVPLYNGFAEVWQTVVALQEIVESGEHLQQSGQRGAIT